MESAHRTVCWREYCGYRHVDCVLLADCKNGTVLNHGKVVVRNAAYERDFSPLIRNATVMPAKLHRPIRHLIKANEIPGIHPGIHSNLRF